MHIRTIITGSAMLWLGAGAAGCAGAGVHETRQEVYLLQSRVEELERTNGRNRVVLEEMEERIFLLQDRVDAARLALQRRDSEAPRASAQASSGPAASPRYQSMPTASAPPPFPEVDPLAVPSNLPVQRVAPAGAPPVTAVAAPAVEEEPVEEVVITMETLEQRFGSEARFRTSSGSVGGGRSSLSDASGGPYAPVDVGGDRLPVVPLQNDGPVAAAEVSMGSSVGASTGSPLAHYRTALDLFNAGNYAGAIADLEAFVATSPEADYMDNALFWLGECHYGLGAYDDALGYFQQVVAEYPDGNKVPDSLLKVALSHERLNRTAEAVEILNVLVDTYPTTDAARRATERLRALQ
jgi:tol-pal system protein YbgF